jgi:hypothetical protein
MKIFHSNGGLLDAKFVGTRRQSSTPSATPTADLGSSTAAAPFFQLLYLKPRQYVVIGRFFAAGTATAAAQD